MKAKILLVAAFAGCCAWAQTSALLNARDAAQTFTRTIQLMESAGVAMPDLSRASAPLIERARQTRTQLELRATLPTTYAFVQNVRAFLAIADATPKPFPFPEEASRQLAELRVVEARLESHFRAMLDQRETQLRSGDRDNVRRYTESNQKLPPKGTKPRIVFFGDSITDLWRLNEYFPDQDFVNRGISGQITSEMLGRMKPDVTDLKPDAVLILAGTNDLARGVSLITIENNYTMMADLADKYSIKVIFASVLPVSDYHKAQNASYERSGERPPRLIRALNEWLQSFCEQRGYTYLDYFSKMVDADGYLKPDFGDDGLHPNSAGYRVMAPLVQEAIQKTVTTNNSPQQKPKKRRLFSKG